jgi:hypothetical protein
MGYSIKDWIKAAGVAPFLRKPYSIFESVEDTFQDFIFANFRAEGARVYEKDWDNLIILDACRFDTFSEENWVEGALLNPETASSLSDRTR